ncbi:MAG: hypothetical protein QNJ29_05815 [Rhizobiaceae bacterium]|nr:hypothetical protein [Rhizobiaceae bacterium]
MNEKTILRVRDFWTSIFLIFLSVFFLFQTSYIPFLDTQVAGVDSADWYNSAALVPYGIFGAMLVLALGLLGIAIKDGGARLALQIAGIGFSKPELLRITCVCLILFFYIFGLVPRVDFILASSLLITCLIWGFHSENRLSMLISTASMATSGLYALAAHFPRSEWTKPHDDDWITLAIFIALTFMMFVLEKRNNSLTRVVKLTPLIAITAPLILVMSMAFGFRQNVPNRTGLLFSQIEYHYYVTLRPLWQGKK